MFKTFLTLLRGHSASVGEAIADQNALVILDQQMRDAASALDRAKKALALAIAQDNQEVARIQSLKTQIADLELRVIAALDAGNEALAKEGADAIASLDASCEASTQAHQLFTAEITRLRAHMNRAEHRIAALDHGRRIARASEAVRGLKRGRIEAAWPHQATLSEAEATLKRLREKQIEAEMAENVLDTLDNDTAPSAIAEKLSAQGFGSRLKANGDDVLSRLRARQAA